MRSWLKFTKAQQQLATKSSHILHDWLDVAGQHCLPTACKCLIEYLHIICFALAFVSLIAFIHKFINVANCKLLLTTMQQEDITGAYEYSLFFFYSGYNMCKYLRLLNKSSYLPDNKGSKNELRVLIWIAAEENGQPNCQPAILCCHEWRHLNKKAYAAIELGSVVRAGKCSGLSKYGACMLICLYVFQHAYAPLSRQVALLRNVAMHVATQRIHATHQAHASNMQRLLQQFCC